MRGLRNNLEGVWLVSDGEGDHDSYTLDELRHLAKTLNVPGPDDAEHPDGYEDMCFCRTCLSYGAI